MIKQHWWVIGSLITAGLSFIVLIYLWYNVCPWPTTDNRCFVQDINLVRWPPVVSLLLFLFLGMSSITIPIATYLNQRFAEPGWFDKDPFRLIRQGIWVGCLTVLAISLQLTKAMNWAIALVLMAVFVLIETFILTRD